MGAGRVYSVSVMTTLSLHESFRTCQPPARCRPRRRLRRAHVCKEFPSQLARVTVVDRRNHHVFQPLLYQVATAGLAGPDIAQPIRSILRKKPNLSVLMASVRSIDLAARRVELDHGSLDFDYL